MKPVLTADFGNNPLRFAIYCALSAEVPVHRVFHVQSSLKWVWSIHFCIVNQSKMSVSVVFLIAILFLSHGSSIEGKFLKIKLIIILFINFRKGFHVGCAGDGGICGGFTGVLCCNPQQFCDHTLGSAGICKQNTQNS